MYSYTIIFCWFINSGVYLILATADKSKYLNRNLFTLELVVSYSLGGVLTIFWIYLVN